MSKLNVKSNILKIGVAIALICILIPVIAAEDVDENFYSVSADQGDVISESVGEASDDPVAADSSDEADDSTGASADSSDGTDDQSDDETDDDESELIYDVPADLKIVVISNTNYAKIGDLVAFGIGVTNNGPGIAQNVVVRDMFISGDVAFIAANPSKGIYDPVNGIWYVGDLAPGEYATLAIVGQVLSENEIIYVASVSADNVDPIEADNIAASIIHIGNGIVAEAASETLPATGNPILMALLAVLAVAGVSLRRKF